MAKPTHQMKLGYFLFPTGHHVAAWRHPDASPGSAIDFKAFVHQIQSAERAKFDMGFLADNDAFAGGGGLAWWAARPKREDTPPPPDPEFDGYTDPDSVREALAKLERGLRPFPRRLGHSLPRDAYSNFCKMYVRRGPSGIGNPSPT